MGTLGRIKVLALLLLLINLSEFGLSKKFEPYEVLGVHRRATQQEIRLVWALLQSIHSRVGGDGGSLIARPSVVLSLSPALSEQGMRALLLVVPCEIFLYIIMAAFGG